MSDWQLRFVYVLWDLAAITGIIVWIALLVKLANWFLRIVF